jgi:hypothetical protein
MSDEEKMKIFAETGLVKDKETQNKFKELFKGIDCQNSFFVFSKKSKIRIFLYNTYKHKRFEQIIQFLIALSSLKLAVDTYTIDQPEDSPFRSASNNVDIFFTIAFTLETVIKAIAMGLAMDENSYLRESWN